MSNGFARGFARTFGPSMVQSQAAATAGMQARLMSRLRTEEKEAEEQRLKEQRIAQTKAKIQLNARTIGDPTAVNALMVAAEGDVPFEDLMQSHVATLQTRQQIAEMQQPDVTAGVGAVPAGVARTRGLSPQARIKVLQRLSGRGFEQQLQQQMADIAQTAATTQEELQRLRIGRETVEEQEREAFTPTEIARAERRIGDRGLFRAAIPLTGRPSFRRLMGFSFLKGGGIREPSDADIEALVTFERLKRRLRSAQAAIDDMKKGGVTESEVNALRASQNLSRGAALKKLGVKEADVIRADLF